MIDAILDALRADNDFMAPLTGGVHRAREISSALTPSAFTGFSEILPCALLRQESETPWGPHDDGARLYFTIFFYARKEFTNIEIARKRAYTLLHRQRLTPDAGGCYEIVHASDLLDSEDGALEASMAMSRFVATIQR